jgi:anthranilate phosphoribosyltransferase
MAEKTLTQRAIERALSKTDFTRDEMAAVINEIMDGKSADIQIAGFLVALRAKGETVDEITGAVQAMRDHMLRISPQGPLFDTCGTGGDGAGTFNISTATAFVVAGAGVKVAKHGNRSISSKCGSADVLAALGVNLDMAPERVAKAIDEIGVGFMFAPQYHGAMKYAAAARREIGVRSIFNVLGPLSNPAGASHQLLGVFDRKLVEPIANVLAQLGSQAAMVVHGSDGLDELTLTGPSHVAELQNGKVTVYEFDPRQVGFQLVTLEDLRGGDAAENAVHLREILDGKDSAMMQLTLLNAAAAMRICGKAKEWPEAVALATQSITSGAAREKLARLVEFSNAVPA